MSFSCGIVGLPNVGKSTFFNALTQANIPVENYPFCTIDPNQGITTVPDDRLQKIATIHNSKKIIPTIVEFTDIAGLVKGASKGEGLGNAFLSHIREVDAIAQIIRLFRDPAILREGKIDPIHDVQLINTELFLADLKIVEKRLTLLDKQQRRGLDRETKTQKDLLLHIQESILQEKLLNLNAFDKDSRPFIKNLNLLCFKPMLLAVNIDENDLNSFHNNPLYIAVKNFASQNQLQIVQFCSTIELELSKLKGNDLKEYLNLLNVPQPGLNDFIQKSYKLLNLVTFFTAGPEETRAWTIPKNTLAPQAAGAIHSDLQKGFIKAEITKSIDLLSLGSSQLCREKGKIKIQGKNYQIQDGDICLFKFKK